MHSVEVFATLVVYNLFQFFMEPIKAGNAVNSLHAAHTLIHSPAKSMQHWMLAYAFRKFLQES